MKKPMLVLSLISLIGLGALISFAGQNINVSGIWEMTVVNRVSGDMTSEIKFIKEGEKLKVTWKSQQRGEATTEGKVSGSEIEWSFSRPTPQGKSTMVFKGKIADENNMGGDIYTDVKKGLPWKAKKKTK